MSYVDRGMLSLDSIVDKNVVDLECGLGAGAQVFSHLGAAKATGIDYYLDQHTSLAYDAKSNIEYLKMDFVSQYKQLAEIDFIYLNNASEHVKSVSDHMRACFESLRPGGILFIAHDNYYQPVGHHDHNFLFLNKAGDRVESIAPRCWDKRDKCKSSERYRRDMLTVMPPVWSEELNDSLDPRDCESCVYFKRSQPWAHLKYQAQFNKLYPFTMFRTLDAGYLNKVTIPQIRQFAIEAGFCLDYEERYWLANEPDAAISFEYSRADLTTFQYFLRLRRPSS